MSSLFLTLARSLLLALAVIAAACSSPAAEGEPCDTSLGADACEQGSLCAKDRNTEVLCLHVCTEQKDCPVDTTCTGTSGSSKVCQTPGIH